MDMTKSTKLSESEIELTRKYDLTGKIAPFLDRHLIYPLIECLGSEGIYDEKTITKLTYDLLKDTYMSKFIKDQFKTLYPNQKLPKELLEKEEFAVQEFERLDSQTKEIMNILSQKEVQEHLKQDKNYNRSYLEKEHGITESKINLLYEFGQFQYNRGDYVVASDLLNNFRVLSTNVDLIIAATWGRLASEIIAIEWSNASDDLAKLREIIDSRSFADPLTQLHHRTWIIHWSLFIFFNFENGLDHLCDLFFSSSYLSTIQAACPWILRYLVAAVVSNSNTKYNSSNFQKKLKDLIRTVSQEQYEYTDPLTEFIKALYIDFNFEEAREKLVEAAVIVKTDFFLLNGASSFLESARSLVAQVYFKVHQTVSISHLSYLLNLSPEQGKEFIKKFVEDGKFDATINEEKDIVTIKQKRTSVYQQILEKTKGLSSKSNDLYNLALQKQEAAN